jgi:hypothetical protein
MCSFRADSIAAEGKQLKLTFEHDLADGVYRGVISRAAVDQSGVGMSFRLHVGVCDRDSKPVGGPRAGQLGESCELESGSCSYRR